MILRNATRAHISCVEVAQQWGRVTAGSMLAHMGHHSELAAMYGGLQLCLGSIIFLSGILKGYLRPGLWLLMMVLGGLATARGSVAFGNFDLTVQAAQGAADVAMSSEFTGYTWYALLFEATFALLAGLCLLNKENQN